jgi:hypothetical protein
MCVVTVCIMILNKVKDRRIPAAFHKKGKANPVTGRGGP